MDSTVFVNRLLNLKKIKYIGLDMDHTLIRYNTKNFEQLVFDLVIEELINNKHYPDSIREFKFNIEDAIRGLVIDSENGNILKLNRYGAIRQSYHGKKPIRFAEQQAFYRSTYVDLSDANYMVIDTSFSISFCVLYRQLVDFKDKNSQHLPSYRLIAQDVIACVDKVHANGRLKQQISDNLDQFVIKDPALIKGIQHFISFGKKIFILTNSEYWYTKTLLDYAINPFLPAGQTWLDLFEYVITLANKPRFFYDNLRFLGIEPHTGHIVNLSGPITPGVYQGGNATTFTDDVQLKGDEILYVGDHIYGDILRLKKDCNWRTALVIDELGQEIAAQKRALPIEKSIMESMQIKKTLEQDYINLSTQRHDEHTTAHNEEIHQLHEKIAEIDATLSHLLQEQGRYYNPTWERVFRAGAEESFFAYQVDRYACIYMEKLANLFSCSPLSYFRAHRRTLAHEYHECNE
jgi:HAD superfamily 5'-nucleotidase-like hydrolase